MCSAYCPTWQPIWGIRMCLKHSAISQLPPNCCTKPVSGLRTMPCRGGIMPDYTLIGPWVRRFLMEHLVEERNLAHNTQASYRDTLILLLPFAAAYVSKPIERLTLEHLSPDLIRHFLLHLEQQRGCSVATRNQRLAAIHAFVRFVGERSPEHLPWCTQIRTIPFRKTDR